MSEIKNLKKAAERILKAIKRKENIVIYGDADLDGVASVIILKETIKSLGAKVADVYFPSREKEGYGITKNGLNFLKKYAPALLIALDCGIGNFKEVKIAKKIGFEVIIIDHHEILEKLPPASIIVDPKQKGDKYPFKQFATVGLVFKLSEALFKGKMSEVLRRNFLELVSLATIADMMPLVEDNKIMVEEGLKFLESSWRPGIQVLLELEEIAPLPLRQKVSKINSFLNIRDEENRLPLAFRLLTAHSKKEAEVLVKDLVQKNKERKKRIEEIIEEIEVKLSIEEKSPIIWEESKKWELALLGVVASFLVQKYKKPVFLLKIGEKESQGTIRAPSGVNVVEAMKGFSKKLITYGGHPQAAGFKIKNENLEEFKEYLLDCSWNVKREA